MHQPNSDKRAVVRLGAISQHRRSDVVELDSDTSAQKVAADAVDGCHDAPVPSLIADLVEELVDGLAESPQPPRLGHRQIIGDVPTLSGDLVLREVVLRRSPYGCAGPGAATG